MDQSINNMEFEAIVLAAGYGSRIASMTSRPKILLEINGKTLLEHHFDAFVKAGIRHVVFVLGYEADSLREEVEKAKGLLSVQYVINEDYRNLGNTYSMLLGLCASERPAMVFDADLIYEQKILDNFINDSRFAHNQILVGPGSLEDEECAKALIDKDDLVRLTVDKRAVTDQELSLYQFAGEAIGILKFSSELRKDLIALTEEFLTPEENRGLNWEHLLNKALKVKDVGLHKTNSQRWIEIDNEEDYQQALGVFC